MWMGNRKDGREGKAKERRKEREGLSEGERMGDMKDRRKREALVKKRERQNEGGRGNGETGRIGERGMGEERTKTGSEGGKE